MFHFENKSKSFLFVVTIVTSLVMSACSDDKQPEPQNKAASTTKSSAKLTPNKLKDKNNYKQMSKPLDKASWSEKGKFRNEFENDCIAREMKSAGSTKVDEKFIKKTCNCIANYMDDHLTDQEAEEFLGEDNHMRALQIKYDAAAFECLQEDLKVNKPKITKFN